jgi:hypothetical protein
VDYLSNIADVLADLERRLSKLENATPAPAWECDYTKPLSVYGFNVQCKEGQQQDRVRSVIVDGRNAIRLRTSVGDDHVAGSGDAERCDLRLGNAESAAVQGEEWWFSHSLYFPDGFVDQPQSDAVIPPGVWHWGSVLNWHDDADTPGSQGPIQLMMMPATAVSSDRPTGLTLQIFGGTDGGKKHEAHIAPIERNVWYDFLYHIGWSAGADGWCSVWLNDRKVCGYTGPTLHAGHGAYLKLANYHTAHGKDSAVIHGPVRRDKSLRLVLA